MQDFYQGFYSAISKSLVLLPAFITILIIVAAISARFLARTSKTAEDAERARLSSEVLGQSPDSIVSLRVKSEISPDCKTHPTDASVEDSTDSAEQTSDQAEPSQVKQPQDHALARDAVYDQLLINDYALGLTQARRAFNVSMAFSILGGLVLITGVALAIFRAATGGQVAGAAITSVAGVLTSGLSQLFRGQSSKALKHLESQASELRRDVRAQTNVGKAQHLLDDIADVGLRSRLQAALILQFTGATLPDLGQPFQTPLGTFNGSGHGSEVTEPSS